MARDSFSSSTSLVIDVEVPHGEERHIKIGRDWRMSDAPPSPLANDHCAGEVQGWTDAGESYAVEVCQRKQGWYVRRLDDRAPVTVNNQSWFADEAAAREAARSLLVVLGYINDAEPEPEAPVVRDENPEEPE